MIKHTKIYKLQWAVFINNHFFPFYWKNERHRRPQLKTQSMKHFLWLKTSQYVKKKKKAIKTPFGHVKAKGS